jgi:serine/threonine protein kinase
MPPSMPPRRPSQDKLVGTLVGNRYLIKSFIAGGGMGSVYDAWDTRFEGEVVVAVKTLRVDLGDSEIFLRLFEEEAQLSAILGNHPRIIRVMDHGLDSDQPFLVMEYLGRPPKGQSLRAVLDEGLPLAPERVLRIAIQICDGLHFAHTTKTMLANRNITGVIHRDIKPSNIFLIQEGSLGETVKILDFGIAKAISEATSALGTNMGFKGTFQYASPEQLRGENLDARSDIYSFGLVLYQMFSGRMPLQSPTNSLNGWYHTHLYEKPLPLPHNLNDRQLPDGLVEVVMSCLEKDANRRPASMKVLQDQLQVFLEALMQNKLEAVGLEQERLEGERKLREQQEAIRREQERLEAISRKRERLEALLKVNEQFVAIQQAQDRLEAEQRDAKRQEEERLEEERKKEERLEEERKKEERLEEERLEAERRKLEQLAEAEKARKQLELIQRETKRLAAARQEQELREQQRLRQEKEEAAQRERKQFELEQREQSLLELQKEAQGQLAALQQLEDLRRAQEQEEAQRRQQEQQNFERRTREQLERIRQEQDQLEAFRKQWIAERSNDQSRAITQFYSEEEWQAELQVQQEARDRLEALLKAQATRQADERMEQQRKQQDQQAALEDEQKKLNALQSEQNRLKVERDEQSQLWEERRRKADEQYKQALKTEQEKLDALREERRLIELDIDRQKRLKWIWIGSLASALLLAGVAIVIAIRTADPTTQLLEQANQIAQKPSVESLGEALEVLDSVALDNQSATESRRLWSEKLLKAANLQAQADPAKAIFLAEKVSPTAPQFQEAQSKIRLWATPLLLSQEMQFLKKIQPVGVYAEATQPTEIIIEMPPKTQGYDLGNERSIKEFIANLAAAYTEKKRNSWRKLTVKSKAGLQASLSFNDWQAWYKEADQVSSTAQNPIDLTKKLYGIIKVTPVPVAMTTTEIHDTLYSRYPLTVYRPQTEQLKIFLNEKLPQNEAMAKSRVRELATSIWQLDHTSRKMVITLLDGQASLVTQGFSPQEVQTALEGMDLKRN